MLGGADPGQRQNVCSHGSRRFGLRGCERKIADLRFPALTFQRVLTSLKTWRRICTRFRPGNDVNALNKDAKVIYHVIQKGDTLWNITNRYKMDSVDELMRINNFSKDYKLIPGGKIKVLLASN